MTKSYSFKEIFNSTFDIDGNEVVLNILGLRNKLSDREPIFLRNIFMNLNILIKFVFSVLI